MANTEPKIIVFDIEIIPDLDKALKYWTKLSSFPGKTLRASVTSICCIGWKVLGEKETHCINAWDFPEWKANVNDDRPLLKAWLEKVKDADAIITHNGKGFDEKYVETRLLMHSMDDMSVPKHVDTAQLSRGSFFFIDNKLQTLGEELCGERKLDHEGWDLWVKTHGGSKNRVIDKTAQNNMEKYCKQDVNLLEKVFKKIRHKMRGANKIPNHNQFTMGKVCPSCGSTRWVSNGYMYTDATRRKRMKCLDCRYNMTLVGKHEEPR